LQTHRHPDLCRPNPATLTHADKAIMLPHDAPFVSAVNAWLQDEIKAGEPARLIRQGLGEGPPAMPTHAASERH